MKKPGQSCIILLTCKYVTHTSKDTKLTINIFYRKMGLFIKTQWMGIAEAQR